LSWAIFINEVIFHESALEALDALGQDAEFLFDDYNHLGFFCVDGICGLLDLTLQNQVFFFQKLEFSCMIGIDGALQFFKLTLHVFNFNFLVFQAFIFRHDTVKVFNVFTILSEHERLFFGNVEDFDKLFNRLFGFAHFFYHQQRELGFVCFELLLQFMSESGSNFTSIDVKTAFRNVLDFGLDFRVPFSKVVNSLSDFLKGDIAFLPFGHLEDFENGENLSNFFVVFFDVIAGNAEVFSDFFAHFASDSVELN
jgi:hypothetical protein